MTLAVVAQAQPHYTVTNLGTAGESSSIPRAINSRGEVGGAVLSATHDLTPFIYKDGNMQLLPTSIPNGLVVSINERGEAIVSYGFEVTPVVLYKHRQLQSLPGVNFPIYAAQISDSGDVVGSYQYVAKNQRAFLYRDRRFQDLGTLGGNLAEAVSINSRKQIVGLSSVASGNEDTFILSNGYMQDLGPGFFPNKINDHGQIIATQNNVPNTYHAFMYSGGIWRDLGVPAGFIASYGYDINNQGQAVGVCYNVNPGPLNSSGSLYEGQMYDLNTLLVPNSGWTITGAEAINDWGQIAGTGIRNGQTQALLLSPVRSVIRP